MEEKDQQPKDPASSNKPVEQRPQLPESSDTKDSSDQNTSPEEPVAKIILQGEAEKPKTKIPLVEENKPETDNMEVHHHGHINEKKKWKEYLFQFLMLFLAVFCGFLAEYQLEHKIEKDREKQFIRSLANDIKADTVRLNNIITARIAREYRLDSLTWLLNSESPGSHINDIYFYGITPARSLAFRFVPNDGTIQQLKNSGAFRLINIRSVADSIAKYDVSVRNFLRQGELEDILIQDYRLASSKIFNALLFDQMLDEDNNVLRLTYPNLALLPYTQSELSAWNYKMYSMKALNKANRRDARLLLRQASDLLITLKKEYHLKL